MALPNLNMSFSPFAILTADEMNDLVENIEALSDGSGLEDASVTNAKLATGAGEPGAYSTWTPTWSGLSGETTNYARYTQIGKTVHFRAKVTLGGAPSGSVSLSLPVDLHSSYSSDSNIINCQVTMDNVGTNQFPGFARYNSSSSITLRVYIDDEGASSNHIASTTINTSVPFTWAASDIITIEGSYEAA